ncbi:hypothetical protein [Methanobacterium sp. ACI-7]|uniref:hypothetical protein n=1 Tax=unclassified Methanobacterium TaxID=2627676 RepID=UPI0039C48048
MDNKGFIFTTDLLLALIVVTLAIGMTINQYESLNYQLQDFTFRQSLDKNVNDAADYLVKNTGTPKNWEKSANPPSNYLPGLAMVDRASSAQGDDNVFAVSNYLDNKKMVAIKHLQDENKYPVSKLVNTNNYYLKVVALDSPYKYLELGQDPSTLNPSPKEIAVANRTVSLIPGTVLLQMSDLAHMNPSNPGNSPLVWYYKENNNDKGGGRPAIFVGPTTEKPSISGTPEDVSVYITQDDINNYDFYIRIDVNQGGGSGVSTADYGFTDGDWVVNGRYSSDGYIGYDPTSLGHNDTADDNRETAIQEELSYINGNNNQGFIKINNHDLDTGDFIKVNDALNTTYNKRGNPYFKLWFRVPSDANADFTISLVRANKGQNLDKVPAQLVLMIWET